MLRIPVRKFLSDQWQSGSDQWAGGGGGELTFGCAQVNAEEITNTGAMRSVQITAISGITTCRDHI